MSLLLSKGSDSTASWHSVSGGWCSPVDNNDCFFCKIKIEAINEWREGDAPLVHHPLHKTKPSSTIVWYHFNRCAFQLVEYSCCPEWIKVGLCYFRKVSGVSRCVPICRLYSVLLPHWLLVKSVAVDDLGLLASHWISLMYSMLLFFMGGNSHGTGRFYALWWAFFHVPFTETITLKIIFHMNFQGWEQTL